MKKFFVPLLLLCTLASCLFAGSMEYTIPDTLTIQYPTGSRAKHVLNGKFEMYSSTSSLTKQFDVKDGTVTALGSITATKFYGDGSSLLGISQWLTNDTSIYYNLGNVGIGTTNPRTKLELNGDGAILAIGTKSSGWTEPNLGSGTRMIWYPRKGAFRAGSVESDKWNDGSIGDESFATGNETTASGSQSTAMGNTTTASGEQSTAMGLNTTASGNNSTAMGNGSTANKENSTAMGLNTTASGVRSTSMGDYTTASGLMSTAMGWQTIASGQTATAIGQQTTASGTASTSMGDYTTASAGASTAMGCGTLASGGYSTAMGFETTASGGYSLSAGQWVTASAQNSIVLGSGIATDNRLINGTTSSFMIGYNSTVPTLFVGPANGVGTVGNVGIGTTNPTYRLDVQGDIRSTGTVTASAYYGDGSHLTGISPLLEDPYKALWQIKPDGFGNFTVVLYSTSSVQTSVSASPPPYVIAGSPFIVRGSLSASYSALFTDEVVSISCMGQTNTVIATFDNAGKCNFAATFTTPSFEVPQTSGTYAVTVAYAGKTYAETSGSYDLTSSSTQFEVVVSTFGPFGVKEGMLCYYKMNNVTGSDDETSLYDSSIYKATATWSGTPIAGSHYDATSHNAVFNGTDNNAIGSIVPDYAVGMTSTTIMMYLKTNTETTGGRPFSFLGGSGVGIGTTWGSGANLWLSNIGDYNSDAFVWWPNEHFLAVVICRDENDHSYKVSMYDNGVLTYRSGAISGTPPFPMNGLGVCIGSRFDGAEWYTGEMHDFAIFNKAFTIDEIQAIYNNTYVW